MVYQAEKTIRAGKMLPYFELSETGGRKIKTWDFRGRRNLLIVYISDPNREQGWNLVKPLNLIYPQIQKEETEFLVIVRSALDQAKTLKQALGLHCPVLADEDGKVGQIFSLGKKGQEEPPIIIITDRYGEIFFENASQPRTTPTVNEILEWLRFVESQCPE